MAHLSLLLMRGNGGVRRAEGRPERVPLLYDPLPIRISGRFGFGRYAERAALSPGRRIEHPEGPALGKDHLAVGGQLRDIVDDIIRIERATPEAQAVVRIENGQRVQQRFFPLVKCDMSGEEENPPPGEKRLIGHRGKDRIRLET